MARIPLGTRHTATLEGTRALPFTCRSCAYKGVALVRSRGEGEASSHFFIGMKGADQRAKTAAEKNLARNADLLAAAATCPRCQKAWRNDVFAERGATRMLAVVIALGTTALIVFTTRHLDPLLAFFFSAAVAGVHYSSKSWLWREVDQRVSVVSEDEGRALLEARVEDLPDELAPAAPRAVSSAGTWVLCPLWKDGYEDVISEPFSGKLRFGLLGIEGGQGVWLEPSDVMMDPDAALAQARKNLKMRSSKPLREVQPGVWKAEWDDWFAAARIAVPEVFSTLQVQGAPIVFTPSENTVFVAGEDDRAGLELATKLASTHAREVITGKTVAGAFTARPWKLEGRHLVPWHPGPECEPLLKQLEAVVGDKGWRAS